MAIQYPNAPRKGPLECAHCHGITYFTVPIIFPATRVEALGGIGLWPKYEIWQCDGCDQHSIYKIPKLGTQAIRIDPNLVRPFPIPNVFLAHVPSSIQKDFQEAALIENLSPAASATLSRRCLQTILKTKFSSVIGSTTNLKAQVKAVLDSGAFPSYIADELHGIRSIGNNAAHPNYDPATDQMIEVENGEATASLDVLEDILDFCFVAPAKAADRKAERERKFGPDGR